MDFDDTPDEAAFRAEARAWLDANATPREPGDGGHGLFSEHADEGDLVARAKEWQARKADAGWAGITWPTEYGGRGGTPMQQVIWNQEEARFAVPADIFAIGIGIAGPVLMTHGTDEQKQHHLRPMLRGEEIWSQFFSEPGAGSDLAGIATRAERDGDSWVINGQKVWASGAQYSRWGTILVRTDPSLPKHQGLSDFIVDIESPGIEIRPIRQITGGAHFNEVFFTDVRVPHENLLGSVGEGWRVALTTLMNERMTAGFAADLVGGLGFGDLIVLARQATVDGRPAIEDAEVRARLASFYTTLQAMKFTSYRVLTALSKTGIPGAEGSIGKLVYPRLMQDMAAFALELQGAIGASWDAETSPQGGGWQEAYLSWPAMRIAGGTDEIQRSIIAERLLGLPPEIRVDKDMPFKDVPTGARG